MQRCKTLAEVKEGEGSDRERIHLVLLADAKRGLADIATGQVEDADAALARLQRARNEA